MIQLNRVRFWHLMVITGFLLLVIGLIMIFLPSRVGDSEPFLIEFFEARIEGSEMGLALIVLGLSCFLIGRKDLEDLRTYQAVQEDLGKTSTLAARLVADRVEKTLDGVPDTNSRLARLASKPELDLAGTRLALQEIQNGLGGDQKPGGIIHQAERGLKLLEALEKEGFSI